MSDSQLPDGLTEGSGSPEEYRFFGVPLTDFSKAELLEVCVWLAEDRHRVQEERYSAEKRNAETLASLAGVDTTND